MSKSSLAIHSLAMIAIFLVSCTAGRASTVEPSLTPSPTFFIFPSATPFPTIASQLSRDNATPVPSPTPAASDSAYGFGYGPDTFPGDINPLSGLRVADPTILNRRPMVIKITNFPRSVRPQWGLNSADHVYEYYLEDELTRFMGVFYGKNANQVGPVRSARIFDAEVVRMYKAIFAFGFADDRVMDYLLNSDLQNLLVIQRPGNCPPLCRIGSSADYNNLFADTALLSQYTTDRGTSNERQNLDGLRFEEKSLITGGGGTVGSLLVYYTNESYNRWDYDPATGRFLRWHEIGPYDVHGEEYAPLMDSLDGRQVAADNLVLLMAPIGLFFESNSTEIYEISLQGSGEAFVLRDGKIFETTWERISPNSLIRLQTVNGSPFPLKPGITWFIVLGQTSHYLRISEKVWRFVFSIP